ncbi:MAG: hypothetical protein RLZZ401_1149 [Pseudomonadota bacterium]
MQPLQWLTEPWHRRIRLGLVALGLATLLACSVEPPRVGGASLGAAGASPQAALEFRQPVVASDAREKPTEFTVDLHTAVLSQAKVGDVLTLDLPNKAVGRFVVARVSAPMADVLSIYAKGTGAGTDSLHLSFSGLAIHGEIQVGDGDWLVSTQGDKAVLIDLVGKNWHRLPPHRQDMRQEPESLALLRESRQDLPAAPPERDATRQAVADQAFQVSRERARAASSTLDVMFAVDLGAQRAYGSTASVNAAIANVVSVANQAYTDSQVNAQIRVAGTYLMPTEVTDNQETSLDKINAGTTPFDGVWRQQVQYGADIVMLLIPFRDIDVSTGTCGIANIGTLASSGTLRTISYSAFVAAGIKTASGNSVCSTYTPVHEIGHVLGSAHDRANSSGVTPAYSYSYGYGVSGVFGDIMSYLQPRIGKFSSPLQTYSGYPIGIDEQYSNSADATKTFNNTAPLAEQFLDTLSRYSGWYWNPAEGGTGWAVDLRNGRSFVAYFHYDDNGAPTWIAGNGTDCSVSGQTRQCVALKRFSGGQTAAGTYKAITGSVDVVSLTLSFSSTFPPTATAEFGGKTVALQRFVFNTGKTVGDRPSYPLQSLPQWRWDASAPGTGIFVEHQGDQVFAGYFNYTSTGEPTWQVSQGTPYTNVAAYSTTGTTLALLKFAEYRNGQTLYGSYKAPVVNNPALANGYLSTFSDYLSVASGATVRTTAKLIRYDF